MNPNLRVEEDLLGAFFHRGDGLIDGPEPDAAGPNCVLRIPFLDQPVLARACKAMS